MKLPLKRVAPSDYITQAYYINALLLVVSKSSALTEIERDGLQDTTYVSADLKELKYEDVGLEGTFIGAALRGLWTAIGAIIGGVSFRLVGTTVVC